jgi:Uri superfamily endonuclease
MVMQRLNKMAAEGPAGGTLIKPGGGAYALILFCSEKGMIRIGKLGGIELRPGFYVYVGSALGPGGVRARVAHHQKVSPRPHWHIDYLRPHTRLVRVGYCLGPIRREHQWARFFSSLPGVSVPLAGFGSSDCHCPAHLFFFAEQRFLRDLW